MVIAPSGAGIMPATGGGAGTNDPNFGGAGGGGPGARHSEPVE